MAGKPGYKSKIKTSEIPKSEQLPVAVPPIIPKEIFDTAQRRLDENLRLARRNAKRDYLLSGLLKHACGSRMDGRTHSGVTYYHCYKDQKFKAPISERGEPQPCSCGWVNGRVLETTVWETVTRLLRDPDLLTRELENIAQPESPTRESLEEELAQVNKRLDDLSKEERRLVEGYRKGLYVDFMMGEEMQQIRREQAVAEERYKELKRQLAYLDKAINYREQIEQLAERLNAGLETMNFDERRELLRLLVDEVVYDDGQITIKTIIPLGNGQF